MANYDITGIAAVYVGKDNGSAIAWERLPVGNLFQLDAPEIDDIEFEGEGKTWKYVTIKRISGKIGTDRYGQGILTQLFGKVLVAAGLPAASGDQAGEASRMYYGDETEEFPPYVALRCVMRATNKTTGVRQNLRMEVFKATPRPYEPSEVGSTGKVTMGISWEAEKTNTDLRGGALPGVPSDGAFYSIAALS